MLATTDDLTADQLTLQGLPRDKIGRRDSIRSGTAGLVAFRCPNVLEAPEARFVYPRLAAKTAHLHQRVKCQCFQRVFGTGRATAPVE